MGALAEHDCMKRLAACLPQKAQLPKNMRNEW